MSETREEQLDRVRLMANGNDKWDLSPNDIAALSTLLSERDELSEKLRELTALAQDNPTLEARLERLKTQHVKDRAYDLRVREAIELQDKLTEAEAARDAALARVAELETCLRNESTHCRNRKTGCRLVHEGFCECPCGRCANVHAREILRGITADEMEAAKRQIEEERDALRARVAEVERELAGAREWSKDDQPCPEDDAIKAAHPVRRGLFAVYDTAMRLVGKKRSKYALVDLVNWLLVRIDDHEAVEHDLRAKLAAATRTDVERYNKLLYNVCRSANIIDKMTADERQAAAMKTVDFLWSELDEMRAKLAAAEKLLEIQAAHVTEEKATSYIGGQQSIAEKLAAAEAERDEARASGERLAEHFANDSTKYGTEIGQLRHRLATLEKLAGELSSRMHICAMRINDDDLCGGLATCEYRGSTGVHLYFCDKHRSRSTGDLPWAKELRALTAFLASLRDGGKTSTTKCVHCENPCTEFVTLYRKEPGVGEPHCIPCVRELIVSGDRFARLVELSNKLDAIKAAEPQQGAAESAALSGIEKHARILVDHLLDSQTYPAHYDGPLRAHVLALREQLDAASKEAR